MPTTSSLLQYRTDGNGDVVDITPGVAELVAATTGAGVAAGFAPGATAAITTMAHEPGKQSKT